MKEWHFLPQVDYLAPPFADRLFDDHERPLLTNSHLRFVFGFVRRGGFDVPVFAPLRFSRGTDAMAFLIWMWIGTGTRRFAQSQIEFIVISFLIFWSLSCSS